MKTKVIRNFLAVSAVVLVAVFLLYLPISSALDRKDVNPAPATRDVTAKVVETWTEEWDPERRCWVRIDDPEAACSSQIARTSKEDPVATSPRYGPFFVVSDTEAAMSGVTNADSLRQFQRMLAAYPHIEQLDFIDAAGTSNDVVNLQIGRLIRARGIATHVHSNGSVRSGAVDLFIAGSRRTMEKGARFAVHCWCDTNGKGPHDFPEHAPPNKLYLDYYMDMGMSHDKAHEFYNLTNSVPNTSALWLGPAEMQVWLDASATKDPAEERRKHDAEGAPPQ